VSHSRPRLALVRLRSHISFDRPGQLLWKWMLAPGRRLTTSLSLIPLKLSGADRGLRIAVKHGISTLLDKDNGVSPTRFSQSSSLKSIPRVVSTNNRVEVIIEEIETVVPTPGIVVINDIQYNVEVFTS
jgi:hypothetical protein